MKLERTKHVGNKVYTYTMSPEAAAKESAAKRAYIARALSLIHISEPTRP